MDALIDRYLNPYFFLALNIAIIISAETVGGGKRFFDSGAIHMIAIVFVLLAFLRIVHHKYIYDPILQKFINTSLAAMVAFAISHVVEFISIVGLHSYNDGVFANIANMYLISLLLVVIGAESFLRVFHARSAWLIWTCISGITILTILSVTLLFNSQLISLDTDGFAPYLYVLAVVVITAIALTKALEIRKRVGMTKDFVNYLVASIIFIAIAILPNIFYELMTVVFKTTAYQAVYLSHFAFYAALSVLFLAFGQFGTLGGMLDEISKMPKTA